MGKEERAGAHKRNKEKGNYVFCIVTSPCIPQLSMQMRNEATASLGLQPGPLWGALRDHGVTFALRD